MNKNLILFVAIALLTCGTSQSSHAQNKKGKTCNCLLPDYGCNGNNKKCIAECYRACELGWLVKNSSVERSTIISLFLPAAQKTKIRITNQSGKVVKSFSATRLAAGVHEIKWDQRDEYGNNVGPGVYFLKIRTSNSKQTEEVVVEK